MSRFIISLFITVAPLNVFGSVDSVFSKSNQLYSSNMFQDALDGYVSIVDKEIPNSVLYYNIANCYYKLNMLGYARLYYEKAMLYNSQDKDVIHNLQILENKLIDEIVPLPEFFLVTVINNISTLFSASQWGYIFLLVLYLSLGLFVLFLFSFSHETKLNMLRGLFVAIPIFAIVLFFLFYSNRSDSGVDAVLTSPNTYVKTAPSISSTDYFVIHEGVKFQLIDTLDNWARIILPDGKDGWIQNSTFQKIEI